MSKCLYVLKFSLLHHQIPSLTAVTNKNINTMSSFILFTYLSCWLSQPTESVDTRLRRIWRALFEVIDIMFYMMGSLQTHSSLLPLTPLLPTPESTVGAPSFWLSCRHHVAELILKAAFQSLFGKTTAPVATLFSTLKSSWSSLDLTDLHFPHTPACYRSSVDPLFRFLDERLLPENSEHLTRGDYKELLEVAKVCLGGTVTRKRGYTLSRPGADSNARWMSKCLYVLKFSLLQHQIPSLTAVTNKNINTMSSFILFTYLSCWLSQPTERSMDTRLRRI